VLLRRAVLDAIAAGARAARTVADASERLDWGVPGD